MNSVSLNNEPIVLDVWADIACPWCFIGLRHLDAAVTEHDDVVMRHRAYELQPDLPPEGVDRAGFFEQLFGSVDAHERASAQLVAASAGTGIAFNLDGMQKVANTHFAHRVIAVHDDDAAAQWAVVLGLFSAYFEQARDISDPQVVLTAASAASGRSMATLEAALEGDGNGARVRADLAEAARMGVQAVPTFVADGRLAVQGAQPTEVLSELLRRARAGE